MIVRLIQDFRAVLRQLDTAATRTAGAYDDRFNEPKVVRDGGDERSVARVEKAAIEIPCQVEDEVMRRLRQRDAGNAPEARIGCVFDRRHLARLGLWDVGAAEPKLNVGDRLQEIRDRFGARVHGFPLGLYCVEVRPISYGIGRQLRLVLMRFNDRPKARDTGGGG